LGGNDRNRRSRPTGRILANMNFLSCPLGPPPLSPCGSLRRFMSVCSTRSVARAPACRGRFPEFPKFPEIKIPEGKGASAIKRLANDLVRFGKISDSNRAESRRERPLTKARGSPRAMKRGDYPARDDNFDLAQSVRHSTREARERREVSSEMQPGRHFRPILASRKFLEERGPRSEPHES